MLMVVIAPVISQSLGSARASSIDIAALADYCGQAPAALLTAAQPGNATNSAQAHNTSSEGAPSDADGQTMLHECGYCSLVHEKLMLAGLPGTVLQLAKLPAVAPRERPSACSVAKPYFPRALSRAPPFTL